MNRTIKELEKLEDFIKVSLSRNEISIEAANEVLRIIQEIKDRILS